MSTDYDVIVVGGGVAGLTSAAYLIRQGYRTLLCEKAEHTGGLVRTFWYKGFAFDAGIRAFENSGILFPMIKSLDLDIQFVDNPVSLGIGRQWIRLDSRESLHAYFSMLSGLFPQNRREVEQIEAQIGTVIKYMDVLYGIDNPLFLNMRDKAYLLKTLLPWLVKYQINIRKASRLNEPIKSYLHRFTQNEALIDMLVQHYFQDTPAFFALSYFGQYFDYNYPVGGTGVLAEKLAQFINSNGGTILTLTGVTSIDEEKNEIKTQCGGLYQYKKLVWAADQKSLYRAVKADHSPEVEKQRSLVNCSHGGDSVLTIFMGMNLDAARLKPLFGPHAFYTPNADGLSLLPDWHFSAEAGEGSLLEWVSLYLEHTTYEISCPSLRDASLAPAGKTGLTVSTLIDVNLIRHFFGIGAYERFKKFCSDKIIEVLEEDIPGLKALTEFTLCATPLTIEHETSNTDGAITGWAFTNSPVPAENRFRKIARAIQTPMKNIYQCGQWTFSPSGLPVSILTGKLVADDINKALRKGN